MHEDGADETSTEDNNVVGKSNVEARAHDDGANESDHEELEAEDKHGSVVSIVHLLDVHIKLLHHLPVEGLESHGVSVSTELELLVGCDDLLQILLVLLFLVVFELSLAFILRLESLVR